MGKSFVFPADVINGEIQEHPVNFTFECDRVISIGEITYRDYDSGVNYIVAKRGWMVKYGEQTFISTLFQTLSSYQQYVSIACQCCPCVECFPYMNGCIIELNGCGVQMCGCLYHDALINNCQIQLNGCDVRLN